MIPVWAPFLWFVMGYGLVVWVRVFSMGTGWVWVEICGFGLDVD